MDSRCETSGFGGGAGAPRTGTDCPANQALLHQNTSGVVDAMKQRRHALFFEVLVYSLSRSVPVPIIVNDENPSREAAQKRLVSRGSAGSNVAADSPRRLRSASVGCDMPSNVSNIQISRKSPVSKSVSAQAMTLPPFQTPHSRMLPGMRLRTT